MLAIASSAASSVGEYEKFRHWSQVFYGYIRDYVVPKRVGGPGPVPVSSAEIQSGCSISPSDRDGGWGDDLFSRYAHTRKTQRHVTA